MFLLMGYPVQNFIKIRRHLLKLLKKNRKIAHPAVVKIRLKIPVYVSNFSFPIHLLSFVPYTWNDLSHMRPALIVLTFPRQSTTTVM